MQPIENPFTDADALLDDRAPEPLPPVRLVDFHCELTSEKNALGLYLDGRVSVVVGTHTHVVTGDERILPAARPTRPTSGMTGPGLERHRVRPEDRPAALHQRPADPVRGRRGAVVFNAVQIDIDPATGRALAIERIQRLVEA